VPAFLLLLASAAAAQDAKADRVPWTTSRITGSPDAPPPFRAERAFPSLTFKKPVHLVPFPGHRRYAVVEEEGMIWTFRNDPGCASPDPLIDLRKEILNLDKVARCKGVGSSYAIAFDPEFERNRRCYVMYVLAPNEKKPLPDGSRVSRFRVTDADPPRIDPASEEVLITWLTGGHNGCDLQFGNDGFLYISTGDAEDPSPPDKLRTGQDCTDLLSSILRIDVRGPGYRVPPDNPFADAAGVRPEVWSYGYRNPWRMSFDRTTGRLWIGDVGWERWELVICAERGGNYGWSVVEGPTPCLPDAKRGPTPILPVAHAIPHPEAASITGGFVYRGRRLKGYEGQYIYGDWDTRRVWANPVRGNSLGDRKEIARTEVRVVAFAEEADGELLLLDHLAGGIHRLAPDDAARNADFPLTLRATGLFASIPDQSSSPGVIPYAINAPMWADGATARHWIALPGVEAIRHIDKNKEWPKESVWPKDSVLAKTLSLDGRKVETQILHYDGRAWSGYSYAWNAEQTDATLAPAEGAEIDLGGGRRWKVLPRAACLSCHGPWAGTSLTLNAAQADRDGQIQSFQRSGILPRNLKPGKPLVDPHDERAPLDARARSYLAANCAHCHRFGGGGAARIFLPHDLKPEEMNAVNVRPMLGTFDLADPYLVCGGEPAQSVLLYRIAKLGAGRMPHLGSEVVDERGVKLLRDWILSLPRPERALDLKLSATSSALQLLFRLDDMPPDQRRKAIDEVLALPPGPVRDLFERFEPPGSRRQRLGTSIKPERILGLKGNAERGKALFGSSAVQCLKCHRIEAGPETVGPELSKIGAKYTRAQLLETILEPSKLVDPKHAAWTIQLRSGDVVSGVILSRSEKEIVLRDVEKETRLAAGDVQRMAAQQTSLMPEGLLQHLTAQEAADLLSYLESLR
jgi:putative heme-binding domain-containing protein